MPAVNDPDVFVLKLDKDLIRLGFEPDKKLYDVEHDVTLEATIASLISNKQEDDRRRWIELGIPVDGGVLTLYVYVRSITQVYTYDPSDDSYFPYGGYVVEGWLKPLDTDLDPSPGAPSIRCFFDSGMEENQLCDGRLQFINPPVL